MTTIPTYIDITLDCRINDADDGVYSPPNIIDFLLHGYVEIIDYGSYHLNIEPGLPPFKFFDVSLFTYQIVGGCCILAARSFDGALTLSQLGADEFSMWVQISNPAKNHALTLSGEFQQLGADYFAVTGSASGGLGIPFDAEIEKSSINHINLVDASDPADPANYIINGYGNGFYRNNFIAGLNFPLDIRSKHTYAKTVASTNLPAPEDRTIAETGFFDRDGTYISHLQSMVVKN